MTARQGPLDKSGGMGIIINTRGRCIRRSVPVSLKLYLDLNDPQKPSPCPVAVFAFQSLDSYRDRMTQNMNRKHEKHTVPPPFEEVTNRLTMYAASLRRVYTAGGFLSNFGRTQGTPSPTALCGKSTCLGVGAMPTSPRRGKHAARGGTHGPRPTKNHGRPNVKRHIPLTASSGCPPRRRAKSRIRPRCGREWPRRSAAPAPPAPDWC